MWYRINTNQDNKTRITLHFAKIAFIQSPRESCSHLSGQIVFEKEKDESFIGSYVRRVEDRNLDHWSGQIC